MNWCSVITFECSLAMLFLYPENCICLLYLRRDNFSDCSHIECQRETVKYLFCQKSASSIRHRGSGWMKAIQRNRNGKIENGRNVSTLSNFPYRLQNIREKLRRMSSKHLLCERNWVAWWISSRLFPKCMEIILKRKFERKFFSRLLKSHYCNFTMLNATNFMKHDTM